jgi:N-acetylmuramoyl-L-alanine amidase
MEYDLNRDETMAVAEALRAKGAQVRINDYKRGAQGYNLSKRGQLSGGADIFVSVHHNAASASAQGSEVWHHPNGSLSDRALSLAIQKRLVEKVWSGNKGRDRGIKSRNLGVLRGVPKTACFTRPTKARVGISLTIQG